MLLQDAEPEKVLCLHVTHRDLVSILKALDKDLAKGALSGAKFEELFFPSCKDEAIAAAVRELLA